MIDQQVLKLIRESRMALSRMHRLHLASVQIGMFQKISDSGVIDSEIVECRAIIERCDTALAEIDRFLVEETLGSQQRGNNGLR